LAEIQLFVNLESEGKKKTKQKTRNIEKITFKVLNLLFAIVLDTKSPWNMISTQYPNDFWHKRKLNQ